MKKSIIIILSVIVGILVVSLITGIIVYNTAFIGKDKAKEIVFKDLNITSKDVKRLEVDFDREGSDFEYTIDFIYDGKEYEYIVDAKTGEIILSEIDK